MTWRTTTLAEIATLGAGNSAPQDKRLFEGGTYPFFRTSDAGRVRIGDIYDSVDSLNESGIVGLRRYPKGTILFPKSGASTFLNHRVVLGVDGFVSSHLATIIPETDKVDGRFLFHFLTTVAAQDLIQDHKYPSLKLSDIAKIAVPLPPLPEQKRIAAILNDAFQGIDAAIANTEKNIANARELYSIYLDTVLKQKVGDWAESRLGDLVSIRHGFAFKSEYFVEDGEYVLLTPGNFFEGGGYRDRGEKQKYYDGEIPDGYVLSEGALLVAMTEQAAGLLGSPLIVPEGGRFLHNQRLGLVVPRDGIPFSSEFFFHAFNAPAFRREIHATASGVKVRHTSPGKLGDALISFPSTLEAQQEVAARLSEVRQHTSDLRGIYERKLESLAELKQSILQKAFSGGFAA